MDYRKINSHIILILLVGTVVFILAALVRLAAIDSGVDVGTANLMFIGFVAVCAVAYLIILSSLANAVIPWLMKRLPESKKKKEVYEEPDEKWLDDFIPDSHIEDEDDTDEPEEEEKPIPMPEPKPARPDWKVLHEKEVQSKLSLFWEYSHLTMGPYVTEEELKRIEEYVELFARGAALPEDAVAIKPERLKNPDLYHFEWNMQYYFGVGKREDVVPWLQTVFTELKDLSFSTIKGKLHDYQTHKYIIPNIDNIPKYMAEKKA